MPAVSMRQVDFETYIMQLIGKNVNMVTSLHITGYNYSDVRINYDYVILIINIKHFYFMFRLCVKSQRMKV